VIARKLTGAGGVGALVLSAAALLSPGIAAAASSTAVSSNWAGYVATGTRFSSVSGTWRQPTATCTSGRQTYSATWVGLGGYREGASSLEQIGTDADCSRSGRPTYSSWLELLPADSVSLSLKIRPGDQISASVTVRHRHVTLRVRNLTTGKRFSTTRHAKSVDVSSAEWIVEAPSLCSDKGGCQTLPLTNFGSVAVASASATAHGHTGQISDPAWSATELELRQSAFASRRGLVSATPSSLSSTGAFTVSWGEQSTRPEEPPPVQLPGSTGAPA